MFRSLKETHTIGTLFLENLELLRDQGFPRQVDLGIQIAKDGRVWLCIDGIAFVRFTPHPNKKMSKEMT